MDAAFILILALVMYLMAESGKFETTAELKDESNMSEFMEDEGQERIAKLNETFYEDPKAFTEISSALGFPVE